ncbi:MAG: hypothetical protein IID43_02165 [Planctomycetes bacterium]|nr:hypothetical protein [Planctomycetota bacterium]
MTSTKKTNTKETATVAKPDTTIKAAAHKAAPSDVAKSKTDSGTPAGGGQTGIPPVVKRPVGAKEIIPFEWKLLARSSGLVLTLFKAIEREDVEAQLERVRHDGYYTNLRIVGADEKVKQAKNAKAVAGMVQPNTKETKSAKRSRKSGSKPRVPAPTILIPKLPDAVAAKGKTKRGTKGKTKTPTKAKDKDKPKDKDKAKVKAKTKAKAKGKAEPKVKAKATSRGKVVAKTKTAIKSRATSKKETGARSTARIPSAKKKAKSPGSAAKTTKRRNRRK